MEIEIDLHELSDGRWGVFRDGLCIHVEHSRQEAINWWKMTVSSHKDRKTQDKWVDHAIGKT